MSECRNETSPGGSPCESVVGHRVGQTRRSTTSSSVSTGSNVIYPFGPEDRSGTVTRN